MVLHSENRHEKRASFPENRHFRTAQSCSPGSFRFCSGAQLHEPERHHLRHSGFTRAHGVIVDGHVERMDMGYLKGLGLYHCTNFPAFQDAWND
jgi:hypothetical protein